jgi:biopolymer transport protein ExbD
MAAPSRTFDLYLRAADTIYRAVPLTVACGWAEQGRLAPKDGVRPGDTEDPWTDAGSHPVLGDYFPRPRPKRPEVPVAKPAAVVHAPVEMDEYEPAWFKGSDDQDDDVDMIPLIDISLVLLIFFMMTSAVAAVSPIDVPGMKNAAELSQLPDALTVLVDKRPGGAVYYALRVGEKPAEKADDNLASLQELLARLDARLVRTEKPPEVRLAAHKQLAYSYVRDLSEELSKRHRQKTISGFGAEVNEDKK